MKAVEGSGDSLKGGSERSRDDGEEEQRAVHQKQNSCRCALVASGCRVNRRVTASIVVSYCLQIKGYSLYCRKAVSPHPRCSATS
jgi:hypothetical protein